MSSTGLITGTESETDHVFSDVQQHSKSLRTPHQNAAASAILRGFYGFATSIGLPQNFSFSIDPTISVVLEERMIEPLTLLRAHNLAQRYLRADKVAWSDYLKKELESLSLGGL